MPKSLLLQTKFLIPQLGRSHLAREMLVEQICHAAAPARILLIAPTGYGKTTLLTEVSQSLKCPVIWIQLDEGDNDPATFMAYLVEALCQQLSGLDGLEELKEERIAPERRLVILLNQLLALPQTCVLILDDYHLIQNAAVHQLLTTLLEKMPYGMSAIVASRTSPRLPLARWRSRNQVLELNTEQIRFSEAEIRSWLKKQAISLPESLVQRLIEQTEGWGAGLQLAATLFREQGGKSDVLEQFAGSQVYIFDYLMDEVFSLQPETLQRFLLRSAVFSQLNPEICAELLQEENIHSIFNSLEKNNLFIVPLDYQRKWYRYHQLFRDFLLSRFKTQQNSEYHALQGAAGAYFQARGQFETAIQHYIQAEDYAQAAAMLLEFADGYLRQGRFGEIAAYLAILPSEIRQTKPSILLLQGRIMRNTGQLAAAITSLSSALQLSDEPRILCESRLELAAIAHSRGHYQDAYDHAQIAVELAKHLGASSQVPALMQLARCASFLHGMQEGRQLAEQGYEAMQADLAVFSLDRQARFLQMLGQICWWHGDASVAILYCRKALEHLDERDTPLKANLLLTLATPSLYQKDYETALNLAQQAIAICQDLQLRETLPSAYAVLGNVLTRLGELNKAESSLRTAIDLAKTMGGERYSQVMAAGYLAQNLSLQMRMDEARQVAETSLIEHEKEPVVYDVYVCQSVLADLLLETEQLSQAKTIFRNLISIGEAMQYRIPLAMAYFGLAYILMREKSQEEGVHYAQASLALLEPMMMQQLYLDQRERAVLVFESLSQAIPANHFVQEVYGLLRGSPKIEQASVIQIQTLGAFRVLRDGQEIDPKAFASAKARDLLAYFVSFRHKAIKLERAMESLWPDGTGSISGFHTALYRLRGALRQKGGKEKFIRSEVGEYRLELSDFEIDIDGFDSLLKRAKHAPTKAALSLYQEALSLYQGEYLDNLYYDWLMIERERLARDYFAAVRNYCDLLIGEKQYEAALRCLSTAIEYDPYQENLHTRLMLVLHQLGERQRLLQHYEHLKHLLHEGLATEPLPETEAFFQELLKI